MRRVLIDHDKAVAGLRDDIGLVNLCPGRAKRTVKQIGRRLRLEANVRGRRADIEGCLARLGQSGGCGGLKGRQRSDRKGRRAPPIPVSLSAVRLSPIRLPWRKGGAE